MWRNTTRSLQTACRAVEPPGRLVLPVLGHVHVRYTTRARTADARVLLAHDVTIGSFLPKLPSLAATVFEILQEKK